jgi:predicted Zn-dependent protease
MDRIEYFARVVEESPTIARARFAYAVELQRAGRNAEAIVQYRAYLALQEDEGNAWGRLAEALVATGETDQAADAYLAGIDQALKFGHHGMADELRAALEDL